MFPRVFFMDTWATFRQALNSRDLPNILKRDCLCECKCPPPDVRTEQEILCRMQCEQMVFFNDELNWNEYLRMKKRCNARRRHRLRCEESFWCRWRNTWSPQCNLYVTSGLWQLHVPSPECSGDFCVVVNTSCCIVHVWKANSAQSPNPILRTSFGSQVIIEKVNLILPLKVNVGSQWKWCKGGFCYFWHCSSER